MSNEICIFGLGASHEFARRVASFLDKKLSRHDEKKFLDGETYAKSRVNVRGHDVYVIASLFSDEHQTVGEKFTSLLFFVGSLKDASAARVTVVSPHLGYARQDRKTESRAPITTKYTAKLLEAAGVDRLLTMDVHNLAAFQNAFRIPSDNLEAKNLLVDFLVGHDAEGCEISQSCPDVLPSDLVILAPDSGGMGRARRFRYALENRIAVGRTFSSPHNDRFGEHQPIEIIYVDKKRQSGTEVTASKVVGEVKGKNVIILDDMVSSGKTLRVASETVEKDGGMTWAACATHGLFVGDANDHLAKIPRVIIADTIPPFRMKPRKGLYIVPTARMFAQAIRRTHEEGGSISDLLEG